MTASIFRWISIGLVAGLVLVSLAYRRDMRQAYERVDGKTSIVATPYGEVEYTQHGTGQPVLLVHGSGGGFDQGELIAEGLLGEGFQAISPSRFGYLRSTFQSGATFDDQAHAYAALLDHLGIEQAAVVAVSHGGPSALLFALHHPERVSSLTLISAGVAAQPSENQTQADQMGRTLTTVFRHDWLYWGLTHLFEQQFMGLMGASPEVIAGLTPDQYELVGRVIEGMNPVSPRSPGVIFDNQAELPGERIREIQAPTLVIHALDDTLQVYANARFAADHIPGARLISFERGGHLLFAVEQDAVRSAVQEHIRAH